MLKKIILFIIKIYQYSISPLFPGSCRYVPTCSSYAYEAIEKFGLIKGIWLAGKRLLRCNPLFQGGIDPVPEKFMF
ncbi:MAG: membrane protein insertion efficiency factor YidD [Desulfonauticus sp.]|nr:membrane protein insertion efficiency factor YidD [Desulfonauticus sp.]